MDKEGMLWKGGTLGTSSPSSLTNTIFAAMAKSCVLEVVKNIEV